LKRLQIVLREDTEFKHCMKDQEKVNFTQASILLTQKSPFLISISGADFTGFPDFSGKFKPIGDRSHSRSFPCIQFS